jgi:putative DNA primase/helicase
VKEVLETIKDLSPIDREKFSVEKYLINLNNGVLNVRTKELMEHSPDYLFLTKIPVDFEPDTDCPVIRKYLTDVLDDDQVTLVQEWFGYAMYPEYFIKKAIIFVGDGDTGKTTLINLLHTFYGEKNVSGVSLQKISSDKFSCAHLYKKYINLYDDLSFKDISDNGAFKIATGGGIITGEKKYGDQFQFKNYAKLTFACNKIPDVKDADDEAYFNRWIVVQFNYVVEEKDKDKQLIHKMTTPQELSGFLNFALDGLARLLENEKFSYNKNADEIKAEMLQSGSSIGKFAFDCLEAGEGPHISKEDMYKAFLRYIQQNNLPSASIGALGKRLPKYANYMSMWRPVDQKTGKQFSAWSNVKFKKDTDLLSPREENPMDQYDLMDSDSMDIIDNLPLYES